MVKTARFRRTWSKICLPDAAPRDNGGTKLWGLAHFLDHMEDAKR